MKKVFCVGLAVCDIPLRPVSPEAFRLDNVPIDPPVFAVGGDAANVAMTLSKLGVKTSFSGLVGRDFMGDLVADRLEKCGVDIRGLNRHPTMGTVMSYILIEPGGERHFLFSSTLNGELTYNDVSQDMIAEADLVYFGSAMCMKQMDEGGIAALFKKARSLGKTTVVDFTGHDGTNWREILEPMLREADVIMPSYREAKMLTGKESLEDIRKDLSGYGIKLLVIKMGSEGSYITNFKDEWRVPTFPEFKAVDTTGAGDSFVGGFILGLLAGWTPDTAAVFGSAVASYNVTKVGATGGVPDFDTVHRYVTEHAGGAGRFSLDQLRKN
ncbi:sugar kinase [Spirochaetia bacterium]|nr:sugar kinase [Spirochaetia bacterium]